MSTRSFISASNRAEDFTRDGIVVVDDFEEKKKESVGNANQKV